MILWYLYKARQMEETIEQIKIEARAEGRAQNYLLWAAWNNRRLEAAVKNIPFDEPPPPPPEAASHSQVAPK